jgi:glycosyltransferase involved in cell wall biosynthesis
MGQILIISAVFPPEPVVSARLSFDLANELSKTKEVVVISPRPTRPYGFRFSNQNNDQIKAFTHHTLWSFIYPKSNVFGRLLETYSFGKACYRFISENKSTIDEIYANTWPLFGQFYAVKAAKKFKIPIIIHVQDVYPESLSNKLPLIKNLINFVLMPIDKFVLLNATKVIAISDNMKNYLSKTRNVDIEKISVVQNWQDEDVFLQHDEFLKLEKDINRPFTFMYLGNIGAVAGVDLLIEAFEKANLKHCRLVIAGSGSMKETLLRKVLELNLNAIEFWDVPDGKVPEIQSQADAMLLPIRKGAASSSIPSKLPAYMFSRKPIISCVDHDSDTAFAIKTSNCGWLLPPENVDDLALKMREVATISHDKLLELGSNGYKYASINLSKKSNLKNLVSILETYK